MQMPELGLGSAGPVQGGRVQRSGWTNVAVPQLCVLGRGRGGRIPRGRTGKVGRQRAEPTGALPMVDI